MSGSCDTTIKTLSSHNLSKFSTKVHNTDRVCFGIVAGVGFFFTVQHLNFHIKHLTQNQRNVDFLRNRRQLLGRKLKIVGKSLKLNIISIDLIPL